MIIKKITFSIIIFASSAHAAFKLDPCACIRQPKSKEQRKAEGTQQMQEGLLSSVLFKPSRPTTAANPLPPLLIISKMAIYKAHPPKKPNYEPTPNITIRRPNTAR